MSEKLGVNSEATSHPIPAPSLASTGRMSAPGDEAWRRSLPRLSPEQRAFWIRQVRAVMYGGGD